MSISLEEKLKALREVENIYRLSKKWQRLTPDEKRPNWERIADAVLKKAMGKPLEASPEPLHVERGGVMHQHSPRTARVIERTLRSGIVHPDVLHSYRGDEAGLARAYSTTRYPKPAPDPIGGAPDVVHYVQHGAADLHYPSGHMQGFGFVPSEHSVEQHVLLKAPKNSPQPAAPLGAVPTKAAGSYS